MKWHMVWIGCVALAACDAVVVDGSGSGSSSTSDGSSSETSPTEVTTTPMTSTGSDTSETTGPPSTSSTGSPETSSTGYDGTSSTGYGSTGASTGYEESSSSGFGSTGGCSGSTSVGSAGFIDPSDTGVDPAVECDSYLQDCPEGEKCNPWSNNGGGAWNALGCFPVDPDPGQIGDVCQVTGSGTSGLDTCEIAAMCWNVDAETEEGICIGLCEGSPDMPTCADPTATCIIQNDGILNLCLAGCDPLLQDCPGNEACYPVDEGFVCAPDASGEDSGAQGDPCDFINACDPGLNCLNAAAYGPGCGGFGGCCSAFCDVNDINPCIPGQECLPWYEEGMAPMGLDDVGVCSVAP